MPIAAWIAVFGIVVGAVVTLVVAYLQRRQMRQVELHRADSTVSLTPPPNFITRHFKIYWFYWYLVASCMWNVYRLIHNLKETGPVTRDSVFSIALQLSCLALNVVYFFVVATFELAGKRISRLTDTVEMQTDILYAMTERFKELEKPQGAKPAP